MFPTTPFFWNRTPRRQDAREKASVSLRLRVPSITNTPKILFFLCGLLFISFDLEAQTGLLNRKVDLHLEQTTLEAGLNQLSQAAGLSFSYNPDLLPLDEKVNLQVQRQPVVFVLNQLLGPDRFAYEVVGQHIIISPKPQPLPISRGPDMRTRSPEQVVLNELPAPEPAPAEEEAEPEIQVDPISSEPAEPDLQPSLKPIEDVFLVRLMINEEVLAVPTDQYDLEWKPWQFTFISPAGTNFLQSGRKENMLSLNLVAGYAGGLRGFELGGVLNVVKYRVRGVQIAGVANVVGGRTTGVQLAGLTNINRSSLTGAQIAGLMNWGDTLNVGIQASGFFNVLAGKLGGVQVSGFGNLNLGGFQGAQVASFINIAREVNGAQVSGFLNVAGKVNGAQVGIINIADSIKGAPIGLFSYVRQGYHRFSFSTSQTMPLALHYKTGASTLFNIFSVGLFPGSLAELTLDDLKEPGRFPRVFNGFQQRPGWAVGYGLGSQIPLWGRQHLQAEWTTWYVKEDQMPFEALNLLNTAHLAWNGTMGHKLRWQAGPTYHIQVSQWLDENGDFASAMAPDRLHLEGNLNHDTRWRSWLGGQFSIEW
jgi:hypothetical protein